MRYDYRCPVCHEEAEFERKIAHRDDIATCSNDHVMVRVLSNPLGVLWAGKFENRFAKVRDGDW